MRPGAATTIHPTRLEPHPLSRDDLPRRVPHMEYLTRCARVIAHDRLKETILRIPFVHPQTLRDKAPVERILEHVRPHHRLIRITGHTQAIMKSHALQPGQRLRKPGTLSMLADSHPRRFFRIERDLEAGKDLGIARLQHGVEGLIRRSRIELVKRREEHQNGY
jgi:hypothetical protein